MKRAAPLEPARSSIIVFVMGSELKLTITPIEQIAVAMTNMRQNAQQILAPFRESFNQTAAMAAAYAESFNQTAAVAASLARLYSDFHASLRRGVEQWMSQNQLNWTRMHEMMVAAAANFERYRNEEEPEACKLLSQAGWLGMDRHFCIEHLRESVLLYKTQGESAMNDAIRDYFNENDSALLVAMSDAWMSVPYLRDRQTIIRDAVTAHKMGLFTLSIPALLPLIDGLSAEIVGTATMKAVPRLAEDRRAHAPEVWAQGFSDFVSQVFYKGYEFGKDSAPFLNRHGILHGRVFDYPSALNSTRVFLVIDAVAEFWREKQKALPPATIQ